MMTEMQFIHDCEHCISLGRYDRYDLYVHRSQRPINTTVLARYGDDPAEYISGLAFIRTSPCLREAARRAVAQQLLTGNEPTGGSGQGTVKEEILAGDEPATHLCVVSRTDLNVLRQDLHLALDHLNDRRIEDALKYVIRATTQLNITLQKTYI